MTKAELVNWMAKQAGITKSAAAKALNAFVKAIHDSLKKKGGKIRVADLGTFVVAHRKARCNEESPLPESEGESLLRVATYSKD